MNRLLTWGALLAGLWLGGTAQAAVIDAEVSPVGPLWQVSLSVFNDGTPSEIGHFTVFFDETLFVGLTLVASPAGWDSLVVEPDPAVPDEGYLDAFARPATPALSNGQSQGGFVLQFAYNGVGAPGSLPFDIVDADYNTLFSGQTVTTAVPEPGSALLGMVGLAALTWRARRLASGVAP